MRPLCRIGARSAPIRSNCFPTMDIIRLYKSPNTQITEYPNSQVSSRHFHPGHCFLPIHIRQQQYCQKNQRHYYDIGRVAGTCMRDGGRNKGDQETKIGKLLPPLRCYGQQQRNRSQYFSDSELYPEAIRKARKPARNRCAR